MEKKSENGLISPSRDNNQSSIFSQNRNQFEQNLENKMVSENEDLALCFSFKELGTNNSSKVGQKFVQNEVDVVSKMVVIGPQSQEKDDAVGSTGDKGLLCDFCNEMVSKLSLDEGTIMPNMIKTSEMVTKEKESNGLSSNVLQHSDQFGENLENEMTPKIGVIAISSSFEEMVTNNSSQEDQRSVQYELDLVSKSVENGEEHKGKDEYSGLLGDKELQFGFGKGMAFELSLNEGTNMHVTVKLTKKVPKDLSLDEMLEHPQRQRFFRLQRNWTISSVFLSLVVCLLSLSLLLFPKSL